jgi:hypothetical protein
MLLSIYAQNSTFLTPPVFEIHLIAIISFPMLNTYIVKTRFNFKNSVENLEKKLDKQTTNNKQTIQTIQTITLNEERPAEFLSE